MIETRRIKIGLNLTQEGSTIEFIEKIARFSSENRKIVIYFDKVKFIRNFTYFF